MRVSDFREEIGRVLDRKVVASIAKTNGHHVTIHRTREGVKYLLHVRYNDSKGWQVSAGTVRSEWRHTFSQALNAWWALTLESPAYLRRKRLEAVETATEAELSAAFAALPLETRRDLIRGTI